MMPSVPTLRISVVAGIGDVDVAGLVDGEAGGQVDHGVGGGAAIAVGAGSAPKLMLPLPAKVVMMPLRSTLRTRLLAESAM